jgi:hypothetical protein
VSVYLSTSGGARVSTQGGIKIFLGRHSGVFNRSGKNVYVNFLTTFFLLLPPIFSSSTTRGGRRTRRPRGAIPSGKGARGGTMPPGSATEQANFPPSISLVSRDLVGGEICYSLFCQYRQGAYSEIGKSHPLRKGLADELHSHGRDTSISTT